MKSFIQTNIKDPLELAKKQAKEKYIADSDLIFSIPSYHTKASQTLVCEGNLTIKGDLLLSTKIDPLNKEEIVMLFCFGDLTIEGELLIDDYEYWPLLFVQGNLTCINLLKGGMPLIVLEDIKTNYFIGEFNDGPMRVGGKLQCLGYIPRFKDQDGFKGHIIAGGWSGQKFDASIDHGRSALSQIFKKDALENGWLDSTKVRQLGRAGESIWLSEGEVSRMPQITETIRPQKLELRGTGIDPTLLGKLLTVEQADPEIFKLIKEKMELNPKKNSYPRSFIDVISCHFEASAEEKILVLDSKKTLEGLLILDWEEAWIRQNKIMAVCCLDDLTIKGDVINRTLDNGPLLFVAGNLKIDNVIKAGAPVMVLGDVEADGLVVGEYNHGCMHIGGDLSAQAYLLLDHHGVVRGDINAFKHSDEDGEWREVLSASVFASED